MPDKPLETDHPETTHLTPTCSCEACAAFTRIAARTLAPSPIRDLLHRRLQPFRHLHDCSGCFRLERSPGGALTHWKAPPSQGARRVEVWRGDVRLSMSVAALFVWRCLNGSAVAPFPHPAHRTGQADLPHPALGQDVTPSPTTGRAQAGSGVRARDELPPNWWTPLLSSDGSGKVSNGPGTASFYG